jgi:hypothetical protein
VGARREIRQADTITNHFLETISMHTQANFRENFWRFLNILHTKMCWPGPAMVTHDEKLTKLSQHHGLIMVLSVKDVGEVTLGHVLVENVDFLQKFAKSRAS